MPISALFIQSITRGKTMGKPGSKPIDLTGQRFGKLTAERYVPNTKKGSYWLCRCDCGNTVIVLAGNLKRGNTKSCGCLSNKGKPYGEVLRDKPDELSPTSKGRRRRAEELCGEKFGRLTLISFQGVNKNHHSVYLCQCSCGKTVSVVRSALTTGNTRSCGCLDTQRTREALLKHGDASLNSPYVRLFHSWKLMLDRCVNPNNTSYSSYGERGIHVCPEWTEWESFKKWAIDNGWKPNVGLSLDRIDVDGNYEPGNCRWADAKTQSNNTRKNIRIVYGDKRISLYDWAKIQNVSLNKAKWMFSPQVLEDAYRPSEEKDDNMDEKRIEKITNGMKVGYFTVISPNGKDKNGHSVYLCRCVCGKEKNVLLSNLRSGKVKSCGCMRASLISKARTKHGDSVKSSPYYRLYRIWNDMIHQRRIESYEEQEIIPVFKDWSKWESFKAWALANGYSDDKKLTRISYYEGYFPDNCIWRSEGEYVLHWSPKKTRD